MRIKLNQTIESNLVFKTLKEMKKEKVKQLTELQDAISCSKLGIQKESEMTY